MTCMLAVTTRGSSAHDTNPVCIHSDGCSGTLSQTTFGVNHLGHFLLANLMLPLLAPDGNVVFVSSGTHDPAT